MDPPREEVAEFLEHRYARLMGWMRDRLPAEYVNVRLETIVERLRWRRGIVEVVATSGLELRAPRVVITVSLVCCASRRARRFV